MYGVICKRQVSPVNGSFCICKVSYEYGSSSMYEVSVLFDGYIIYHYFMYKASVFV